MLEDEMSFGMAYFQDGERARLHEISRNDKREMAQIPTFTLDTQRTPALLIGAGAGWTLNTEKNSKIH